MVLPEVALSADELLYFDGAPDVLPIYLRLRERIGLAYPYSGVKVGKTQISFYNKHLFAMASRPRSRKKGWPEQCLLVSFGLNYRKASARIAQATEPYPKRWTHHVLVRRPEEIDAELMAWIDEAYRFATDKS